jgi:hypothetical protein
MNLFTSNRTIIILKLTSVHCHHFICSHDSCWLKFDGSNCRCHSTYRLGVWILLWRTMSIIIARESGRGVGCLSLSNLERVNYWHIYHYEWSQWIKFPGSSVTIGNGDCAASLSTINGLVWWNLSCIDLLGLIRSQCGLLVLLELPVASTGLDSSRANIIWWSLMQTWSLIHTTINQRWFIHWYEDKTITLLLCMGVKIRLDINVLF